MSNVTVRNLPEDIYQALKAKAERNRRSLNQQVIVAIREYVDSDSPAGSETAIETIERLRRFRAGFPSGFVIDEDEFDRFKRAGRD